MFLWGEQKRCVEQLAREKGRTCYECEFATLSADEAQWQLGGGLDVYLTCSNCYAENSLPLSPDDARRCGFDPNADLPEVP